MKRYTLEELIERNRQIKAQGGVKHITPKMPDERNDRVGKLKRKKERLLKELDNERSLCSRSVSVGFFISIKFDAG